MSTLPVITNGADLWKSETKMNRKCESMIRQDDDDSDNSPNIQQLLDEAELDIVICQW